jgi:hypothetical protein
MVDEDFAARVANDEAESYCAVEPFHDTTFTRIVRIDCCFLCHPLDV